MSCTNPITDYIGIVIFLTSLILHDTHEIDVHLMVLWLHVLHSRNMSIAMTTSLSEPTSIQLG